jgi:hypothetical protein
MQGMNIYLAVTAGPGEKKSLLLRVVGVGHAVRITESPTERPTISIVGGSLPDAGVSMKVAKTSDGAVQSVTLGGTEDTRDSARKPWQLQPIETPF